MLNAEELTAFYSCDVIETGTGCVRLTEKQKEAGTLKTVRLSYCGELIKINPLFFDRQKEAYRKHTKHINYRLICDGVLLYHRKKDENYLIIVEMKSGFNDVKKAFTQISSSYIKLKTHLESFKSYEADEYKELGLIFCFPPKKEDYNDAENNGMVMDSKLKMVLGKSADKMEDYLNCRKKELESYGKTELSAGDMNVTALPLKPKCLYKTLTVLHQSVDNAEASVDLDEVLCRL